MKLMVDARYTRIGFPHRRSPPTPNPPRRCRVSIFR